MLLARIILTSPSAVVYLPQHMDAFAQPEFFDYPVIESKPKRGIFRRYLEATREHGHLATVPMIAAALGMSRQRVDFLIGQGRLAALRIGPHNYVPLASLELFLTEERKSGRSPNDPSLLAIVKSAFEK